MRKLTRSQRQSRLDIVRSRAMPEVKKIAKKYGRNIVIWCVTQMREYEKKVKQLEILKSEAAKLEREIS